MLTGHNEALTFAQYILLFRPNCIEVLRYAAEKIFCREGYNSFTGFEYLRRWIEINPEAADAFRIRGRALQGIGRYPAALENYQRSLQLNPYDVGTHNCLVDMYFFLKQYEPALKHVNISLSMQPNNIHYLMRRGYILRCFNREQEAMASYATVLNIEPQNTEALHDMGSALCQIKQFEEALGWFNKSLQINPNDALVWFSYGKTLCELKRFDEGLGSFEKSLELDPHNQDVIRDRDAAREDLKRETSKVPPAEALPQPPLHQMAVKETPPKRTMAAQRLLSALGDRGVRSLKRELQNNPDINQQMSCKNGDTPLMWVIRRKPQNAFQKAKWLMWYGASLSAPNKCGETAKTLADRKNFPLPRK